MRTASVGVSCLYAWTSLGTKKWDGLPLYTSYRTFIGNREIELDNEISRAELPTIVGKAAELPIDPEFSEASSSQSRSSFLVEARRTSQEGAGSSSPSVNSPASAKKFIPPSSFYGAAPKPKPKGPLYVVATSSCEKQLIYTLIDTTPTLPVLS